MGSCLLEILARDYLVEAVRGEEIGPALEFAIVQRVGVSTIQIGNTGAQLDGRIETGSRDHRRSEIHDTAIVLVEAADRGLRHHVRLIVNGPAAHFSDAFGSFIGLNPACDSSIASLSSSETRPAGPIRLAWRNRRCRISAVSSA